MSGQTTGWVLRNGPTNRAMRAVLVTIADAANRDGENARPSMRGMVEGSLYSEGHVRRTVSRLVIDGWVEVEERGGGEGHESVFRVCVDRVEVAHGARLSEDASTGISPATTRVSRAVVAHKTRVQTRDNAEPTLSIGITDTDTDARAGEDRSLSSDDDLEAARGKGSDYRFEDAWRAYPPRRDEKGRPRRKTDKEDSRKEWVKLSYADKATAWQGIQNMVKEHEDFAPDMHRWLARGKWRAWAEPAEPVPKADDELTEQERNEATWAAQADRVWARIAAEDAAKSNGHVSPT